MNWTVFFGCFFACMEYIESQNRFGNPHEWSNIFDDDILLPITPRGSKADPWPNGIVPFNFYDDFDPDYYHDVLFAFDIYNFVSEGCITFIVRSDEMDYLNITQDGEKCGSYVGMVGGAQQLYLAPICFLLFGSILHEVYHALGFHHEHQRRDRDTFIYVNWENVGKGFNGSFAINDETFINETRYDYTSISHYSQYAFSFNGEPTISTINMDFQNIIGHRQKLSEFDKYDLARKYFCPI